MTGVEVGLGVSLMCRLKDGISVDRNGGGCQCGEAGGSGCAGAGGEDSPRVRVAEVEKANWFERQVAVSRSSPLCDGEGSDVVEVDGQGKSGFSGSDSGGGQF